MLLEDLVRIIDSHVVDEVPEALPLGWCPLPSGRGSQLPKLVCRVDVLEPQCAQALLDAVPLEERWADQLEACRRTQDVAAEVEVFGGSESVHRPGGVRKHLGR